jgi:hypothetical protein
MAAGLIAFGAYLVLLFMAARGANPAARPYTAFLFAVSSVVGAVYLGSYSKDAFVLLIVALLLLAPRRLIGDALVLGLVVWYASEFRQYWLLVGFFYVVLRFLLSRRKVTGLVSLILSVVACVVVASLALMIALHVDPDNFRVSANEYRDQADNASTMIVPFVSGPQPIAGIVNNVLTVIALMIPVPLALLGGVYYAGLAVVISAIWFGFLRSAVSMLRQLVSRHNWPTSGIVTEVRCLSLVVSFVVVQSLFEPDYGSALRHLTPLLPAMLFLAQRPARVTVRHAQPVQADAFASNRMPPFAKTTGLKVRRS